MTWLSNVCKVASSSFTWGNNCEISSTFKRLLFLSEMTLTRVDYILDNSNLDKQEGLTWKGDTTH